MDQKLKEKILKSFEGKPNYERFQILNDDFQFSIEVIKELYPEELKTFDDLVFKRHPNTWMIGAVQAVLTFDNNQWVSIVGGGNGLYGDGVTTFELGFELPDGSIDVMGWLSKEEITLEMFKIQKKEPFRPLKEI